MHQINHLAQQIGRLGIMYKGGVKESKLYLTSSSLKSNFKEFDILTFIGVS